MKILTTLLSAFCFLLSAFPQSPAPEVRFYYAITTRGAYELAGFSNVGDFSRWFHATQWTTNENLFVIATKEKIDDIDVPFYTEATGHALKKTQRQILDSFTANNYIIPKMPLDSVLATHPEIFFTTNDLLPEAVHVIGPNGKVYLNHHTDTIKTSLAPGITPLPPVQSGNPAFRISGDGQPHP